MQYKLLPGGAALRPGQRARPEAKRAWVIRVLPPGPGQGRSTPYWLPRRRADLPLPCFYRQRAKDLSDRPKVKAQSPVLLKIEALSIRVKFELETASFVAGEVGCSLFTI